MSRKLIEDYYSDIEKIKQYGGSNKELSLSSEFAQLLNSYCKTKNLLLIKELEYKTIKGSLLKPDGTVKDALRLDWGYWESKDEYDDLDKEIQKKIEKGYPTSNIIFEDSQTVVLIQQGIEVERVSINDSENLDTLFQKFINYERPEIQSFHRAIEQFKEDLPLVLKALRELIEEQRKINIEFRKSSDNLLILCQQTINPNLTVQDIREMLIQHILTEEIFITIFNDSQFHRENNIAKELQKVADTFFIGRVKKDTLSLIDHYYLAIKAAASNVENHHEKQKFLKVLYENFYRSYNPKGADRLGIFYTPNEIVQFIIKSANYLTYKHFERLLSDQNVEILDPATGTGTFITELIEQIPQPKLEYKYVNEIHCNEVAILPYYIANLNIEFTYKQKTGKYEPFENICFVDTLDNTGFNIKNKQTTLFDIGADNLDRIKRQNKRKISIIVGNPPYNANQLNENENNKNKTYPVVDKRIKETYIKYSKAQKTKLYDMYTRFFRWATDRLSSKGIIAFITNRSYIDSYAFDGFRKCVENEFNHIYIVDTQSDVRANPKISGTTHNVFGIQTGVAIIFLVKDDTKKDSCFIEYYTLKDEQKKEEKLEWLATTKIEDIKFEHIIPDKDSNWINISHNDFDSLLPLVMERNNKQSIFNFYSLGVSTNRDEWVYDFNSDNLTDKIKYFIRSYNVQLKKLKNIKKEELNDKIEYDIKWSRDLKKKFLNKKKLSFNEALIVEMNYRPFIKKKYYSDKNLSDILTSKHYKMFGDDLLGSNMTICLSGVGSSKKFSTLISEGVWSLDYLEKTQGIPLYLKKGRSKVINISEWGFRKFREHYKNKEINGEDIFYYIYAVLNNPNYKEKYGQNLKTNLPRIPLYEDFTFWKIVGKELAYIHLNYDTVEPYKLQRIEKDIDNVQNKVLLKAIQTQNKIIIDSKTSLNNIPSEAWEYKICNRSAIEWVLDQYKNKLPREEVLKRDYHVYDFNDNKEEVINLVEKIVNVSIKTVKIINMMKIKGK
jgi:predicted helicase